MKNRTREWLASNWIAIVIGLACLVQLAWLLTSQVAALPDVLAPGHPSSPVERSAYFAFGGEFEGYITFLRAHVPLDALVIVPPENADYILGNQFIAQYLLFPRRVANCSRNVDMDICVASLTGQSTYILAVNGFPPREIALRSKEFLTFDDKRGLYVPKPEGQ